MKEIKHEVTENDEVEKKVEVSMLCKVEWFYKEESTAIIPVSIYYLEVKHVYNTW